MSHSKLNLWLKFSRNIEMSFFFLRNAFEDDFFKNLGEMML